MVFGFGSEKIAIKIIKSGKIGVVENLIWNTFPYYIFFQIPMDFEIFKRF
jgi:hypothetical protein